MAQAPTFQQAIEMIEALPGRQQDELIEIVRRRRIDQRRDDLAREIATARAEYGRGEVARGSAEDLMREFDD